MSTTAKQIKDLRTEEEHRAEKQNRVQSMAMGEGIKYGTHALLHNTYLIISLECP